MIQIVNELCLCLGDTLIYRSEPVEDQDTQVKSTTWTLLPLGKLDGVLQCVGD